jgi:hypothetical protein
MAWRPGICILDLPRICHGLRQALFLVVLLGVIVDAVRNITEGADSGRVKPWCERRTVGLEFS